LCRCDWVFELVIDLLLVLSGVETESRPGTRRPPP
jgi:hypothetical protein